MRLIILKIAKPQWPKLFMSLMLSIDGASLARLLKTLLQICTLLSNF